jgi:hypothetical protein
MRTGISYSAWLEEDDATILTALVILASTAEED